MNRDRLLWIALAVLGIGLVLLLVNHEGGQVMGLENDRFARLLRFGVLAAVLSVLFVGARRVNLGQFTRNVAIWLAIALVLVAGYQYRYELQDVASRLTAGLVPGSPLSLVTDDGRAAVMLERMSSGHFEVRASVNGVPISMLVDTGATGTVLTAADARRAGYDPDTLSFDVPVMTANGLAYAARATADEIRVGDISRTRLPVMIAEGGRLGQSLLGMNFIGTLSGFDMRGERLILRD